MQTPPPSRRQLLGGCLAALAGLLLPRRTDAQSAANEVSSDVTMAHYEYDAQGRLVVAHTFSGSLRPNSDGTYTYNPAQGFATGRSFQYDVPDGAGGSTVTLDRD